MRIAAALPRLPRLPTLALLAALTLPAFAVTAHGDEPPAHDAVVLTDGRTVKGHIVGENERFVSIRSEGVVRAYPKDRVSSISRGTPAADPSDGADEQGTTTGTDDEAAVKAKQKAKKKTGKQKARAARDARATDVARLTPQASAWLTELLNRMRSPAADDAAVRHSLAAALEALGPGAVARIKAAAGEATDDEEEAAAAALRRAAATIEKRSAAARSGSGRGDAADDRGAARQDVIASLGLDRAQARSVKGLLRSHLAERRTIASEARAAGTSREDVVASLAALRARTTESIRALLTEEQATQFDGIAREIMERVEARQRRAADDKARGKKKKGGAEKTGGSGDAQE